MGYDQWKTASPFDDEPDPIEEAERFVKRNADAKNGEVECAVWIIQLLLAVLEDEGVVRRCCSE